MSIALPPSWLAVLKDEFEKPYMAELKKFLQKEKEAGQVVYPKNADIFRAFNDTPFDKVKVVILGRILIMAQPGAWPIVFGAKGYCYP
jgi:uracil-DNA glycosylase